MSESGDTPAVQDNRVTDVDGDEVDDTLLNWLMFIALHLEAEGDFDDDDLLEDVLLALGYQNKEQREPLQQPRQPHRLAFRDALERLEAEGLVQQLPGPKARYRLAVAVVNDLQAVTERIGTVWSDSGTEAIDSKAEIGWLIVTALRILDSSRVPHDDLDGKLASLLGDRAEDARNRALQAQLADLAAHGYVIDASKTSLLNKMAAMVAGDAWALTERAWGGTHSLRDNLSSDFGHALRFDEETPSADAHESSQAEDAQNVADGDALEVQTLNDQGIGPLTDSKAQADDVNLDRESERREPDASATDDLAQADTEPQEGPHDTYSPGRSLGVGRDPADTTDTDQWAYDHTRWCWLTLEVMRGLSQDVVDEEIPNSAISGALADRLQLSPVARDVRSSQNPAEKEYTARCATMRDLLEEIKLIERGNKSATWRILPAGAGVSKDELVALIEDTDVGVLSGANGTYRGNKELETVIAREGTSRTGQTPSPVVRSEEDRATDVAGSAPARAIGSPQDVSSDHELSDVQLCIATLQSMPMEEGEFLRQPALVDAVRDSLGVSATYSGLPAPLWVKYDPERKSATLLEYRMEHVLRALSIERSGLIRDGGLDFSDAGDMWFLTARGRRVVQSSDIAGQVASMTAEYFDAHDYANWTDDDWKSEVLNILWESGGDGRGFEHLVARLLQAQQGVKVADVQRKYLDSMGVDIVAKVQGPGLVQAQMGTVVFNEPQREAALLVQCKRYRQQQISPDAASKLFGFTARLRDQATRGDVQYDIAGGLIAFFGDLTRDATWTFWALRAAWDALSVVEAYRRDQRGQEPGERPQPDVRWEIWDGQRIFALMKEHRIGVAVADNGDVAVDQEYLRSLLRGGEHGRET